MFPKYDRYSSKTNLTKYNGFYFSNYRIIDQNCDIFRIKSELSKKSCVKLLFKVKPLKISKYC